MNHVRLTVKAGSGADAGRKLWFLDVGDHQVAEGVEESSEECFAAAAVTLSLLDDLSKRAAGGAVVNGSGQLVMPKEQERQERETWMGSRRRGKKFP